MISGGEESHPGKTKTVPEGWCLFPTTPDGKLQFHGFFKISIPQGQSFCQDTLFNA